MLFSQSLWCGARVYVLEPESMLWSQSLCCGARVYVVEPESVLWSQSLWYSPHDFSVGSPLGTYPNFFLGRQVEGTILNLSYSFSFFVGPLLHA